MRQTSSESPSSGGGSRFESDWESADGGADGGDDDGDLGFMEEEAEGPRARAARGADGIGRRLRSRRRCAGLRACGLTTIFCNPGRFCCYERTELHPVSLPCNAGLQPHAPLLNTPGQEGRELMER